jgi:ADP-heptose:LPS heptosyltransferase
MSKLKLNLGCGNDCLQGYINVDKYDQTNADMLWDLEKLPWPWETNSVEKVLLKHVLEHIGQAPALYLEIIKELYRVCAPDAEVQIDVPYPLHRDYLGDPTHCRPVTAESLWLFNLEYADQLIANHNIGTPLARYIGVDFVMIENLEWRDAENNLQASSFKLKVRKNDMRIKIAFMGPGLGDCCMGLCTAHALADAGYQVTFAAQSQLHDFIRACPHVYEVTDEFEDGRALGYAWYQVQKNHQVNTSNNAAGITKAPNSAKSLDLIIPQAYLDHMSEKFPGTNRIAIHAMANVKTRKWPEEYWQELANRFRNAGIEVLSLGMSHWGNTPQVKLEGVTEILDLPPLETVALLRQCKVLISADAGPIQLAGATDCGIVGLYSVILPEWRLPFRHGELGWNAIGIRTPCEFAGCYGEMVEDHDYIWVPKATQRRLEVGITQSIEEWCLNKEAPYSCMNSISVDQVYTAAIQLYKH